VTLACEDGQQVEAHKVILASSSPFFQNVLRRNKHPHPLIYMRGVKSEDLVAIVDFLYYGEANVYQENIDAFLAIAEELNLKGLTGNENTNEVEEPLFKPEVATNRRKQLPKTKTEHKSENNHSFELEKTTNYEYKTAEANETAVAVQSYAVASVNINKELDEQVKSMMRKSENLCNGGSKKADMCTVCGKEGFQRQIKDHIEANHLEGVSLPCNSCEKTFRSRSGLRMHVTRNH